MCGIAGIVGDGAERQLELIRWMSQVQRHRGPDGEGTFADSGVLLGHVRLAILDPSDAGRQPMTTPDGRYTIIHNGEVYNYLELREELAATGPFRTATDTEVILRAYATWGSACLDRFIGMFSFAIWDVRERTLFCARDRFGIKPFYYAEQNGRFVFASEIKAVLQCGMTRRPSWPILRAYLAWGYYEHGEGTFFDGVYRLLPGHCLTVRPGGRPVTRRYYDLAERVSQESVADEAVAVVRLRRLLEDAVRLRLRADVKIGVTLSGGLDSSTLLALVDRMAADPERIEAFSCDYDDSLSSERPWIEAMARATRRRANISRMGPDEFWRSLDSMTWYEEEPFGGVATVAWTGLYRQAGARGVTVLLDGSGLDDILGGYRHHHAAYLADCLRQHDPSLVRGALASYQAAWEVDGDTASRDARRAAHPLWSTAALDGSDPVRPDCLDPALSRYAEPPPAFRKPFASPLKNLMYQGLVYTKIPRALRFKDRLSMAHGRELRVPFLDHRLVEYCFGLPESLLIREGQVKWILRQAMVGLVPDAVRLAPKRSVPTPQREWIAGPLRQPIEEMLTSASFAARGLVHPAKALEAYRRYALGDQANSFYIWQWVNLEVWFRVFIDPPSLPEAPVRRADVVREIVASCTKLSP